MFCVNLWTNIFIKIVDIYFNKTALINYICSNVWFIYTVKLGVLRVSERGINGEINNKRDFFYYVTKKEIKRVYFFYIKKKKRKK